MTPTGPAEAGAGRPETAAVAAEAEVVSGPAGAEVVSGPAGAEVVSGPAGAEIVRHHRVIERWLSGEAEPGEFAALAGAHADGFTLAGPDGRILTRDRVLDELRRLHGAVPGLRIEIREVRVVAEEGPLLVAVYEERQPGNARRSSVVLRRTEAGLRWLHLHETWLPAPSPQPR
ncbi:DUF4440 domain-containing protein [Nonomuraea typhae]|uniref:DUF4440 domain-containing protein n=1 Tax=Nonomuraea typhae TaxID=2603600 RepID=A0ABW7Z6H8_9ACTN